MSPAVRPLALLYDHLQRLVEGRLWAKVLIGLGLGASLGFLVGPTLGLVSPAWSQAISSWVGLPGDLFIGLVQMIMIPLIVSSIVQGVAGGLAEIDLGRLGPRLALYFLATTVVSIVIGVFVALQIKPGAGLAATLGVALPEAGEAAARANPTFSPSDVLAVVIPRNPLASMVAGEMLSIVAFSLIVAMALRAIDRKQAEPILALLGAVQQVCMTITGWAMRLAPIAVFGLLARVTSQVGLEALAGIGLYMLCVVLALIGVMVVYALLVVFVGKVALRPFFAASKDVLLLAFSVASSAAVMPMTIKTAEEKLKVRPAITRFLIPVGAILNMNGTAAYQAVATLFLAQVYGLELALPALVMLVVTTVGASVGTPSTPGGGIIILSSVLSTVGVPIEGIALILGVDHLLGMMRTTVNVGGDLVSCTLFRNFGLPADESEPSSSAGAESLPHAENPLRGPIESFDSRSGCSRAH